MSTIILVYVMDLNTTGGDGRTLKLDVVEAKLLLSELKALLASTRSTALVPFIGKHFLTADSAPAI